MPTATFTNDQGEERSFDLRFCPVHIMYRGRLWALQPGAPGVWRYRDTTVMELTQLLVDGERASA
jgi:hypothetical protein